MTGAGVTRLSVWRWITLSPGMYGGCEYTE